MTTSSSIVSPTGSRSTRSNNTTIPKTNERCEYTTVCLPIVYGSVAYYLGKDNMIDEYHTHQWTLYVRGGSNNENLSVCIAKVIFQLHPSFAQPLREVTVPPYEVTETGWGEFEAQIRIIWKDNTEQSIIVNHFIKLYPTPPPSETTTATQTSDSNNIKNNDNTNNQQQQQLSQVSMLTTGSDDTLSGSSNNNTNNQEQQQDTLSSSKEESSSSISKNEVQRVVSEKYDEIVFTNPHKSFFQQLQLLSKVLTIKELYFEHEHFPMYSDTDCFLKLLSAQNIAQQELSSIKQKFIVTQNELQEIESSIIDATNALSTATEQQQQHQQQVAATAAAAAASKVSSSIIPGIASQSMMMNTSVGSSIQGQYVVPNPVMTGSIPTGASSTAAGVGTAIHPSSMNPKPSKKAKISSMPPPTTSGVASSVQLSNNNKKGKSTTTTTAAAGGKASNTTGTKKKATKKSATQQSLPPTQATGVIPPTLQQQQQQQKCHQQQQQQQIPMTMGTTAGAVATTTIGGGKKAIKAVASKAASSGKVPVPVVATSTQQQQQPPQPVIVPVVLPGAKSTTSNIPPP